MSELNVGDILKPGDEFRYKSSGEWQKIYTVERFIINSNDLELFEIRRPRQQPKEKSQEELDEEKFQEILKQNKGSIIQEHFCRHFFYEALAYARQPNNAA